jgi:vitamin K-dependent gamma-carboxylase
MTATEFCRWLTAPVSAASLTVFRIGLGIVMALALVRFWARGWIEAYYLLPTYWFSWPGLAWLKPWPGIGMYLHIAVLILAALGMASGRCWRLSLGIFWLGFTALELIDKSLYLNHYYAVSVLVFLLLWIPKPTWSGQVPRWALLALQIQISLIYVYAGIAKIQPDWLVWAEPLRRWLQAESHLPLIGPLLAWPPLAWCMAWGGMFFDLTIPLWLSLRITRPWAYAAVGVFHLLTALLFPIGLFPWLMMLGATLLFSADWPLRFYPGNAPEPQGPPRRARFGLPFAVLTLSLCLQLVLPWRHLLYPGNVLWTEEGFRFSWRVMLIEKTGMVEYRLYDPVSQQQWVVDPASLLTPLQHKMMRTQPDMIHQFAHELGQRWRQKGYPAIEVRAEAWAALNGRPSQRLIDPQQNLLAWPPGLSSKPFILPMHRDQFFKGQKGG